MVRPLNLCLYQSGAMFFYKMCFLYYVGEFKNQNARNFLEALVGTTFVLPLTCTLSIEHRYTAHPLYARGPSSIIKYDFSLHNLHVYLKVNGMNNIVIKNKNENY